MSPAPRRPFRARSGADQETTRFRLLFLQAVHEVRPKVSFELVDRVYPAFMRLADAVECEDVDELWVLDWDRVEPRERPVRFIGPLPEGAEEIRAEEEEEYQRKKTHLVELREGLRKALLAWAEPYNLHRDEWILDYAVALLSENRGHSENPRDPPHFRSGVMSRISAQPPVSARRSRSPTARTGRLGSNTRKGPEPTLTVWNKPLWGMGGRRGQRSRAFGHT